ncbi:MAG TPA: alpha/beta fold hydrolase, partial [Polyangiaceae bacterium]
SASSDSPSVADRPLRSPLTQGGSPVRENRTPGSVRGAARKGRPYRDEFYRSYPERLRTLVLAGTYAGWKGSLSAQVCQERLASCLRDSTGPSSTLIAKLMPGMFSDAGQDVRDELSAIISEFHPIGFRAMSLSSAETDTRDLLPNIAVPTLLLWGDDDRRSPLHIGEQFRDAIPHAELAIIPNAGHVSNMEQPEAFNAHLRRFCQ